jgi:four helix bundle protein
MSDEDFNRFWVEEDFINYNKNKDFTSLEAWKKARDVKLFFYRKVIPLLPKIETYQLGAQIRDASVSTTANIAEGYGRYHYQEAVQFYRISRGSLYELKDHLISCYDFNYIDSELLKIGEELIETAKKTLNGYIKYVLQQKKKKISK